MTAIINILNIETTRRQSQHVKVYTICKKKKIHNVQKYTQNAEKQNRTEQTQNVTKIGGSESNRREVNNQTKNW